MSSLFRSRRFLIFVAIALMLPLLAACAGDDDDEDATATPDTASVATEADDATPEMEATTADESTPDDAGTPEGTADDAETPAETPDAMGTADETPDAAGTPDSTPDTDATADETPDPVGTADGTPDADSTADTGMGGGPFDDLTDVQAELPNFTLNFTGQFENVPDDTGAMFTSDLEMMLAQSERNIYHLRLETTGDESLSIEIWSLEDATFIAEGGGEPIELPAGTAEQVAPVDALAILPPVELLESAEEVGQEEIDGRTATRYRVEPEQAALILVSQNATISNPQGDMDIWVDDELGILLQMIADITFENEDGTEGRVQVDHQISDIDETEAIEAPN